MCGRGRAVLAWRVPRPARTTPLLLSLALLSSLSSPARAEDARFASLLSDQGWEQAGKANNALLGEVLLALKDVEGTRCLLGSATVDAKAATMLAVVQDIPGATSWSTAGLTASRVLGKDGVKVDYLQVLDVPDWTMASDRYWVLRGAPATEADGSMAFRWDRFDWRAAYPLVATELDRDLPKAVEPAPNFGAWDFKEQAGGTLLRYYLCTESGSLPTWLQKAAATKTLPSTMADVVREAHRRDR